MKRTSLLCIIISLWAAVCTSVTVFQTLSDKAAIADISTDDASKQDLAIKKLAASNRVFSVLQGRGPLKCRLLAIGSMERICRLEKNDSVYMGLIEMLKDSDSESISVLQHPVREATMKAITNLAPRYPELSIRAAKSTEAPIRDFSRVALGPVATELREHLAAVLGDSVLCLPAGSLLASAKGHPEALILPWLERGMLWGRGELAIVQMLEVASKFQADSVAAAVLPYLQHPLAKVRFSAGTALAAIASSTTTGTVISLLQSDGTDATVRASCAASLGRTPTDAALRALAAALTDGDIAVRNSAVVGLRMAGSRTEATVRSLSMARDPETRKLAAASLSKDISADTFAVYAVDKNEFVRLAALRSTIAAYALNQRSALRKTILSRIKDVSPLVSAQAEQAMRSTSRE